MSSFNDIINNNEPNLLLDILNKYSGTNEIKPEITPEIKPVTEAIKIFQCPKTQSQCTLNLKQPDNLLCFSCALVNTLKQLRNK